MRLKMSKRKKKTNKKYVALFCIAIILILICIGAGASNINEATNAIAETAGAIGNSVIQTWTGKDLKETNSPSEIKNVSGKLEMHTIDVGQGDSTLFIQGTKTMLIDAGTKAKGKTVVEYLQKLGIKKIDVLIGTHPHDDHMGGMAEVINTFEIGKLYAPDNRNDNITTSWYMEFLDAVDEKKVGWKYPKVGETFDLGEAKVKILGPTSKSYMNKNNYSIATKVTFGETDILLTGDAEELAENEILNSGYDIEAEVFKAGHHGSDTSNTEEFLKAVNPKYGVISCKFRKYIWSP